MAAPSTSTPRKGRLKDRNLRARPEVTLLLVNPENAYHWMEIYGRVVEIVDETNVAWSRRTL